MKTDRLITVLSTGVEAVDPTLLRRRSLAAVVAGAAAALLLSVALLKVNPALAQLAMLAKFWVREGFCLVLGVAAAVIATRLGRPGRGLGWTPLGIAAPVLVMWALGALALLAAAPGARVPLLLGHTARACPFLIALLSLGPFGVFIWMLRGMAPTRTGLAGAVAGFAAGAFGALAYTLHCPELAAPFVGVWYLLGMLIPTALGAWAGPRLLRW